MTMAIHLAFRRLTFEDTDGVVTAHFHANSTPGTVVLAASATDPNTGQAISANLTINVTGGGTGGARWLAGHGQFRHGYQPRLYPHQSRWHHHRCAAEFGCYSKSLCWMTLASRSILAKVTCCESNCCRTGRTVVSG